MENYSLNVDSDNIGGYFSSEQIDLLSIIQCDKSINRLLEFVTNCDQIKYLYSESDLEQLRNLDIESAKRKVFKAYQDSMVLHNADRNTSFENQLKNMGIKEEHYSIIKDLLRERNKSGIRQFVQENYKEQAEIILSLSHHLVSVERDQIKSDELYDEFVLLNSELANFDTMLIGSGKIYNVVNDFYTSNETEKRFDFYSAKRDLDFAYRNGKQVRFHSLLVKDDASHLFDGKSKEEILVILKDYVKATIDFVSEYNSSHKINIGGQEVPVINAIDLFNEIVSFDKNEYGEYYNIWETKYGITMDEMMSVFEYAKENKPEGVSYLYNEPFLENDERRKKVFETLQMIDSLSPGLIDTLGSQMHITIGMNEEYIKRCFEDFKRLQEMTGKKIQITEFDMSLGSREILRVFGNNADVSLEQVYEYKRQKINGISKVIMDSGVDLSGLSYWSLTDGIDCNLERLRTNLLERGEISDIQQIPTACGGLIPTHQSMIKSIRMNSELDNALTNLLNTSLLTSRQALEKYSVDSNFSEHIKQVQEQQKQMLEYVQQIRKNNPNLSDEVFYKQMMVSFLSPVVQKINDQYGQMIPQDKLKKLNGLLNPQNITFTFDKNQNDIQANSEKGQLLINPQKTLGSTLEEKIVCSMGASIHESFHLLVNMLKSPEQAEKIGERLMYTIATTEGDKEVHFAPGKYGQVLSEGFVEKLSSEFARKNGFYYTLNPSYIPYVELCSQLMNQDKSIDTQFLFTKTGDDIVSKMTPEVKSKFEETERLVVINNFETKESRRKDSLKGITSECVKTSWMERKGVVQEVKTNESFKKPLEIKRQESKEQRQQSIVDTQQPKKEPEFKTFQKKKEQRQEQQRNINQMSQSHQETYHQQTQITQQHNQSKAMEKPKVKTLTKSNNSSGSSSGFVDTLILTLITGFVAGAIFMIIYYICK